MYEGLTYYVVKPYYMTREGVFEGRSIEVSCASAGKKYADKLDEQFVGFVLFSRTRCPWTGNYLEAEILCEIGVVI